MLRDRNRAILDWINEVKKNGLDSYIEDIKQVLGKERVDRYFKELETKKTSGKAKLLRELLFEYGSILHERANQADEAAKKYDDYSFLADYVKLLNKETVYSLGLYLAENLNGFIKAADNPKLDLIPEAEIKQFVDFFSGKGSTLPTTGSTFEYFKHLFLLEALRLVKPQKMTPAEKEKLRDISGYFIIRQGAMTNKLAKTTAKKAQFMIEDLIDSGYIRNQQLTINIDKFSEIQKDLNLSTAKLLDLLIIKADKEGLVTLPLDDYMNNLGLKDIKEARKNLRNDLNIIYNMSLDWTDKNNKNNYAKLRICSKQAMANGKAYFAFNSDFNKVLDKLSLMYYPQELLKIKNTCGFKIGRKILEHIQMNLCKPNENIISVKTILDICQELPTYEEVSKGNRSYAQKIISPIETALDVLVEAKILNKWEYVSKGGGDLSQEQLDNISNYVYWCDFNVKFDCNYPKEVKEKRALQLEAQRKKREKAEIKALADQRKKQNKVDKALKNNDKSTKY